MSNMKKYILTAVTLGSIAAVSALLIGLVNLATADTIKKNDANKIKDGLAQIYSGATFSEENKIDKGDKYKYLESYYVATKDNSQAGYVFQTSGKNDYGSISMLVGISNDYTINKYYLISDEQSFATDLEDNYVNPFNNGQKEYDDVTCGATYGAKLIKAMAEEASTWAQENLGGGD